MWTVTETASGYSIADHNGDERATIEAGGGISTEDVRAVMHDRASDLKDKAQTAVQNDQAAAAVVALVEWMTVVEDMAGDQIELPSAEQ